MKIVIGVTGEIASGKDTFTTNFIANAIGKRIKRVRFSDILHDTLEMWDIPATRTHLQNLAIVMDQGFGKGTLTHAMYHRITYDDSDIVIVEGVRWMSDVEMIKKFEDNYLVYITAEQNTRFERVKKRHQKIGEENTTFDQFVQEDSAPTETDIKRIGAIADFTLDNNGELLDFQTKIKELYDKIAS